jgi:hypothetical protein
MRDAWLTSWPGAVNGRPLRGVVAGLFPKPSCLLHSIARYELAITQIDSNGELVPFKILSPVVSKVLILSIGGLLFFVIEARRTLGARRGFTPGRSPLSSR